MKSFVTAAALATVLVAGPLHAQQAAAPAAPAQTPAAPAAQPAAPPPAFPAGAKIAYVNLQRVADEASEGKVAQQRAADLRKKVEDLRAKKTAELQAKQKSIETAQSKLNAEEQALSAGAREARVAELQKMQLDLQRNTEDASAEVSALERDIQRQLQQLQFDFQQKLAPVLDAIGKEKALHMMFSVVDGGVVWAEPGLDVTGDVIKRFDAAVAAAPKK